MKAISMKKLSCFVFSSIIVIFLVCIFLSMSYLSSSEATEKINLSISKKCNTVQEYHSEVQKYLSDEVNNLSLNRVEVFFYGYDDMVNNQATEMILYYSRYINSFAEGGKIEAIKVYIDTKNNIITNYEYFKGSSKQYNQGGDTELISLDIFDYSSYLPTILETENIKLNENADCYAEITFLDNGNVVSSQRLFIDNVVAYYNVDKLL